MTYRAAIIGLGFVGAGDEPSGERIGQRVQDLDGYHLQALSRHPRVEIVAGAALDAGQRERFEQRTGCRTFADWRELLRRERPDIVSVATWTPSHAEITIACAEAGVPVVYCEKPIASRVADAEAMIAACEQAGTLLVVNHNRRFDPDFRRLREFVAASGVGELTSCTLQWPTGRLGCVGTHFFDALQMLTGRRIEAVSGTLDAAGRPDCRGNEFHDPGGWGMLRLESGLIATVDAADYATVPARLTLNGTHGCATTGGDVVTIEGADGRRDEWPGAPKESTSMDRAVAEIVEWLDQRGRFAPRGGLDSRSESSTLLQQESFSYPAAEALRTLEAIVGFHVSHDRRAAWVDLPLTGDDRQRELFCG